MDVGDLYKVEVDQSTAKDLLRIGGFLLLLDVPQGTVVGLDQQVILLPLMKCEAIQRVLSISTFILNSSLWVRGPQVQIPSSDSTTCRTRAS